jgi:hypothetical protein
MRNAVVFRFDAYHPDEPLLEIEALERAGAIRTRLHFTHLPDRTYLPHAETLWHQFYMWGGDWGGGALALDVVARMERHLSDFLYAQSRHYQESTLSNLAHFTRGITGDTHLFYRLVRFLGGKLAEHEIQVVLFDEIPHYSISLVLYWLARDMGIPTLLFQQSIWNDRCWCLPSPEDLGNVTALPDSSTGGGSADTALETKLYYVVEHPVDLHREWIERWKRSIRFTDLARLPYYKAVGKKRKMEIILRRLAGIKIRQHEGELAYAAYQRVVQKAPDLETPFVLFPLHHQPEVTTLPLGGRYHDQLRAIEELASIVPPGVRIYVKEHPESYGAVRSVDFYQRLAGIPGATLVDKDLPTPLLLEKSLFVATITGTIGFEALRAGKSALTFGYAWYNPLPGVFRWEDRPRFEEIVGHAPDRDALRAAFERLLRKTCRISPRWSIPQRLAPPSLDVERNCAEMVRVVNERLATSDARVRDLAGPRADGRWP